MAKSSGKITRAITIDSRLDARMRKSSDVNWSAVASIAFEQELEARKRRRTLTGVIERLRESREASATEHHRSGVQAGSAWARSSAEYEELRLVGDAYDSLSSLHPARFVERTENNAPTAGEKFVLAIHPEIECNRQAAAHFWEFALAEDLVDHEMMQDDEFVRGFAEGALAVWNEVKDQI